MYINKVTNELIEDNNVELMFANVSFPNGVLDESFLAKQNIVKVEYEAQPVIDDFTQKVEQDKLATLENGVYIIKYSVLPKTEVEIIEYRKSQVPQSITKLQAMKQLQKIGKWTQLKAILADPTNEDINDEWILSNDLNRSYPLVAQMATALELSEEEVDDLFIEASQIV